MKQLWILLWVLSLNTSCAPSSGMEKADTTITYKAETRGSSFECVVDKQHINIMSLDVSAVRVTKDLTTEEWEEIMGLLKHLQLEKMGSMKAPSENSSADRARIASLKVRYGKKIYESNPFDERNPPTELGPLINKILALSETVE